ncbi:2-dehydropantoate 2-reductase [Marinobacter nanhaiticus D15-8W]|uniref:2-dehydropantoate 2-reductase n=1 Tax=Marinobacter nanhaiticus D15-8W TaxID=626887 RepID=N6WNQ9_9GAMM|nr:2-dehydropantoate 2-reductase [Marinobacter nanhaiticus]ENO12662.1 2-dehydropantoate 2-reductase [Marinobacter nanhaiticus D15-8W]BES70000.1 2-dehydropantoate 2-reductase [Marinobacter nanhaiticus D15-8W]
MTDSPRIVIFGAGSVGCYLGGRLLAAGANVVMVGRPKMEALFASTPLRVSDYLGVDHERSLTSGQYTSDPGAVAEADLVLLTVKSAATEEAGQQMAPHLKPGVPVISLQNGISNAERLEPLLPDQVVLAGMVPFNVLQKTPGHFHHGTEGQLMAAHSNTLTPAMLDTFARSGLPLTLQHNMTSVLWSKLLLNLNNPINALSGKPLRDELSQRSYRLCLAMAQRETLQLLNKARIRTVKLAAVPMPVIPMLMSLPDWLFRRLAQAMLAIDPLARSSMWEDLQAGRRTEVDWINGEVVHLAERLGRSAPVNQQLVSLIRDAEAGKIESWTGQALLETLKGK